MPDERVIKIIDVFEELLNLKGIKLPCKDRENNSSEACIYGEDYYNLENAITQILKERKNVFNHITK